MKKSSPIFTIILLALFFGLLGGIGGEIIARIYMFEDLYKIPLFGEIDVPKNVYGGSNLIIESPRKVVVEQNTKVLETVNSVAKNIVGIYRKIELPEKRTATTTINIEGLYSTDDVLGQGFVVTSDGWLMSSYVPTPLVTLSGLQATTSIERQKELITDEYVVITDEGSVYDLIDVEIGEDAMISFWRISASGLGVKQFEKISDLERGQLVVATNYNRDAWLTTVSKKQIDDVPQIMSSEELYSEITLVHNIRENFGEGFLFNTDGDLIALIKFDESIIPVSSYFSCLTCLLEKKDIYKPFLGLNYVNLEEFFDPETGETLGVGAMVYPNRQGVAVVDGGPADIAGIMRGDVITAVNTIKIDKNNNLSDIISEFGPGEDLNLDIQRGDDNMQILVKLTANKEID